MLARWTLLAGCLTAAAAAVAAPDAAPAPDATGAPATTGDGQVHVYLPPAVASGAERLTLGAVCIVRCDEAALEARLDGIAMGRGPWAQEEILLQRPTILARLASSGVPASRVRFHGAEAVRVRRGQRTIKADRLLRAARTYLDRHHPAGPDARWRVVAEPEGLAVEAGADAALSVAPVGDAPAGLVRLRVTARANERELGATVVSFRRVYRRKVATAVRDLQPGETITPDNARVELVDVEQRPSRPWAPPFGLVTAAPVPAGRAIRPDVLHPPAAGVLVERNATVMMQIEGPGFRVTGVGLALEDGRAGDTVRVRNTDTKRIVTARVMPDGTVRPVYEETRR